MSDTELAPTTALVPTAQDFMPVMNVEKAIERYTAITTFIGKCMIPNVDYGAIPGTDKDKKVLLKPGAEKLGMLFGLIPSFEIDKEEDWSGERHNGEPFFAYNVRCILRRNGQIAGEGVGSANSWEARYRWRWVKESDVPKNMDKSRLTRKESRISEFAFAVDKAVTTGQYGKPQEYWDKFRNAIADGTARAIKKPMKGREDADGWEIDGSLYRIPNPDILDLPNTILKISKKRSFIDSILTAVGVSDVYTQDLLDEGDVAPSQPASQDAKNQGDPDVIDATFTDDAAPPQGQQQRQPEPQQRPAQTRQPASRAPRGNAPSQPSAPHTPTPRSPDHKAKCDGLRSQLSALPKMSRDAIATALKEAYGSTNLGELNDAELAWVDGAIAFESETIAKAEADAAKTKVQPTEAQRIAAETRERHEAHEAEQAEEPDPFSSDEE